MYELLPCTKHMGQLPGNFIFISWVLQLGSTLASGSIGHGFESEHRLFSHHGESTFSKLRSLAKYTHWTIQFVDCCIVQSLSYPPEMANRVAAYQW